MPASIVLAAVYGDAIIAAAALGSMGYAAATFAINFAVSIIVSRAFGAKPPQSQDTGARQQVPPANNNTIPVVYGDAWLGGVFVDAVLSSDQKSMYYVMAISSISSDASATFSFDRSKFYYGDRLVEFDSVDQTKVISLTDGDNNIDTKISGNLYISLYTSTNAGVITPINGTAPHVFMGGSDIPASLRWPSSGRQMNGLAFAIIKLNYSADGGVTGLQPITYYCSHYPKGGSVAKPGDVWYDYMTDSRYGASMNGLVDSSSATALNSYSDQTITYTPVGGGTSTQARYRINGVVDTGKPVLDNVEKILECCDSWMAYNAASGKWSVVINKSESSSFSFDDTNLVGEIRVSAVDINQQINQIQIEFPSKKNRDQPDLVYMETPAGMLYANEPPNRQSTTLEFTNDSVQAQYLGNRRLEQAREDLIVTITSTYPGIQVDAGDVVSITNSDYGWSNKLFRAMKVSEATLDDGNLGATLELSEYNSAVYDNANITEFTAAPNSGLAAPSYFSELLAPTVTGYPGDATPTFSVTVYIPITGRVVFGTLYYTTVASPTISDWKQLAYAETIDGQPVLNSTVGTPQYYTFANQILAPGNYYFGYNVGNPQGLSSISPISAEFVWSPVAPVGPTGPTGGSGLNSATIYLYNKSSTTTPPALFSGDFTYTFATGVLSGGTLNGWAQTPPAIAAGEFLFVSLATASSTAATDTIPYTEFSTPEVISGVGEDGAKTAIVSIFQKSGTASPAPADPTGTFTYTFATAVLSGGTFNGWSQTIPSLDVGEYMWQKQATAFSIADTDTIAATEFSGAVVVGAFGPTGPTGLIGPTGPAGDSGATGPRNALVYYFYATAQATAPTAPTTAQISYNFSTGTPLTSAPGWSASFNPGATGTVTANNKYWAVRAIFQENTYGGSYSETISSPFVWENFDGLVTFTNLTNGLGPLGTTTTYIDGGTITADTLRVNSIKNNTSGTFNTNGSFGLGTGTSVSGREAAGAFTATSTSLFGLLVAHTGSGAGIGAGTTRSTYSTAYAGIIGVGAGNSTFSTFKNQGLLGGGSYGGVFQTGGADNLQTTTTADIRLAYYTGGTSYAYYITSGAAYPFTAGHDALQLLTEDIPEVGDLMYDVQLIAAPNVNDCITQMSVSNAANQKGVIGVFAGVTGTEFVPASLGEYVPNELGEVTDFVLKPEFANIYETYRCIAVNAVGEGKMNVCGRGGNIEIGDLISSSDMPGKGMKQSDDIVRVYTVARARQSVIFSSPDEVQQIACIYISG